MKEQHVLRRTAVLAVVILSILGIVLIGDLVGEQSIAYALTEAECRSCHTGGLDGNMAEEHHAVAQTLGYDCQTCHPVIWDKRTKAWVVQVIRDCTICHGTAGHEAQHDMTGVDAPECGNCHQANVVPEHISAAHPGFTCDTCHNYQGTKLDPLAVVTAIANGMSGLPVVCSDCHGPADHTAAHDKATTDGPECDICHSANVVTEHVSKRGLTCGTCHSSLDLSVIGAIEKGSGSAGQIVPCSDCHKYSHSDLRPEFTASYHPAFEPGANPNVAGLVSPWTSTSLTKCTDCHVVTSSYPVTAKDGSKVYLALQYRGTGSPNALCYKCHSSSSIASVHENWFGEDEHKSSPCYYCHTVHGSPQRRLLAYGSQSTGSKLTNWIQNTGSYDSKDCGANCSDHSPSEGTGAATITGKITDSVTGNGLVKAKLTADKYDIVQYSDTNGNYQLGNLASGTYTITASASGVASKSQTVTVSRGQTVTLNFLLGPAYKVTGKVTDSVSGLPIAGATVSANPGGYLALTGSDGSYTLSDVTAGTYTLTASSIGYDSQSKTVVVTADASADFALTKSVTPPPPSNLALNKSATASGYESGYPPSYAFDGSTSTRWWKKSTSTQWLRVDLGSNMTISKVVLNWHSYYAKEYKVEISTDGSSWSKVYETTSGSSGIRTISFSSKSARYVRTYCTKASSSNGYSIYEFEVYQ